MTQTDVLIIGAGAAGLFCAGVAAQQGLQVLLLDHSPKVAEKIRISGGGRANFTNKDIDPRAPHKHFLGENPQFARSALSRYTAADFTSLMHKHGIAFHEKHKGQLFCDRSAQDLIDLLLRECEAGAMGGAVTRWQPCGLQSLQFSDGAAHAYTAQTSQGEVQAKAVVVATGGLSIPKIGATDLGFRLAQQFGLKVVTPRPALVPLTFSAADWQPFAALAGLSLPVDISTGIGKQRPVFEEDLLFTHRGLSGPAVLQISSYWQPGTTISLNLLPQTNLDAALLAAKQQSTKQVANAVTAGPHQAARSATPPLLSGDVAHLLESPCRDANQPDIACIHSVGIMPGRRREWAPLVGSCMDRRLSILFSLLIVDECTTYQLVNGDGNCP
jgi:predicted Rossmann fold flavoprotein